MPIFYRRLEHPLAIEIFPGEKVVYYSPYGDETIFLSDIRHIELIVNSGKSGTKSIIIETEKEREPQVLWKYL